MSSRLEFQRLTAAYILTVLLIEAVFSIYDFPNGWFPTLMMAMGFSGIPFLLCYYAEEHKVVGGIGITIVIFAALRLMMSWMWTGWRTYGIGFQEWALTAGTEVENATIYYRMLWLGCVVFFGFTVYYFAKVLYRTSFLMLISLLPCVLSAKVLTDIDNVMVFSILCMNLILLILYRNSRMSDFLEWEEANTVRAAACFVLLLLFLASVIPKKDEAKYYDVFEDLFLGGDTHTELGADFSQIGTMSGDAGRYSEVGNRRLYRITGDGIEYLKRQTFDIYDYKRDRWLPLQQFSGADRSLESWKDTNRECTVKLFQELLQRAEQDSPGFAEKFGLKALLEAETLAETTHSLRVTSLNFSAAYYVAPVRTLEVIPSDEDKPQVTDSGCFQREKELHPRDYSYDVIFYDQYHTNRQLLQLGAGALSMDDWEQLLQELSVILPEENSLQELALMNYLLQCYEALDYRNVCRQQSEETPQEIVQLAQEVVKDCYSDYEKAKALENFLHGSDFTYDLRYMAKDDSPEYFLFQSKRGTCSDYASAYVLMARAVGLAVRYAEGYVPEPATYENVYYVKDSDSHAYPEVYLPVLGWTVFDPTSANVVLYDEEKQQGFLGWLRQLKFDFGLMGMMAGIVFAIVIGIVFLQVVWPLLTELVFGLTVYFSGPNRAVEKIYDRVVAACQKQMHRHADAHTPRELAEELQQFGVSISLLAECMEGHAYAGKEVSKEEKEQILGEYHAFIRKKHKLQRK